MEWRDIGFVLATRRHGEGALIVELLTAEHGRHAGLVRGGQSPRRRAVLQPGNAVSVLWRGRLAEHLGTYECELLTAHASLVLDDADRLTALNASTTLLLTALPEREPHSDLYEGFSTLLQTLATRTAPSSASGEGSGYRYDPGVAPAGWVHIYVAWECTLLASLGYGLDLSCCAVTGIRDNLTHVSPRTGRAVSREAAVPYRDKLLPLPAFLWRDAAASYADIAAGLALTYHFLLHHLLLPQGGRMPEARERLAERMRRYANAGMVVSN